VANGFPMTYRFSMEPWDELSGELAIDLANTLRLERDGSITDLLADRDRLARWRQRRGVPGGVGAPALQALRGEVRALLAAAVRQRTLPRAAVAAVNRAVAAAPAVAQLEAGELVYHYHASPPDAFLADVAASAIMVVGGKGTRLRPLTVNIQKSMLPCAGVPFLTHLLARAQQAGVEHMVLATSYRAELFEPAAP